MSHELHTTISLRLESGGDLCKLALPLTWATNCWSTTFHLTLLSACKFKYAIFLKSMAYDFFTFANEKCCKQQWNKWTARHTATAKAEENECQKNETEKFPYFFRVCTWARNIL